MVPNLGIYFFFHKNSQLGKFQGTDFKFQPKDTQIRIFRPKIKDFYFWTKVCKKTNTRTLISNMLIVFRNCRSKHTNKSIFGPQFKSFHFARNFVFRKVSEGVDFKHENSFAKVPETHSEPCQTYKMECLEKQLPAFSH